MKMASGILPPPKWLSNHGWRGLVATMGRHPEAFSHILQHHTVRTIDQWVAIAEKLEKRYGKLPHHKWLQKNNFSTLAGVMLRHRNRFRHIVQECKRGRTPQEWLTIARKLVKQHGSLPSYKWLKARGFGALENVRRKNMTLFRGIKRKSVRRSLAASISLAETLVRRYGAIPSTRWLRANGHSALLSAMSYHKSSFAHLSRKREFRSINEWVICAEEIARQKGVLPTPTWLMKHHRGLHNAMLKEPSRFAHIKQDRRQCHSPKEWVSVAKELKKRYGKVPSYSWLYKHNHSGLVGAMKRHPKLFASLKP